MAVVADGTGVTSWTTGGVAEEEAARDLFFLKSASRLSVSCSADQNYSYTILFSFHNRKKISRISLHKLWLPLHACDHYSSYGRFFSTYALPGNGARNACWYFLVQLPSEEALSPSPAMAPEMAVGIS
jgi:hypothetical protein